MITEGVGNQKSVGAATRLLSKYREPMGGDGESDDLQDCFIKCVVRGI